MSLHSAQILIVDDQGDFGRQFKGLMLDRAAIGSLFVRTLTEAAELIESKKMRFDAVIADWLFENGEDTRRRLFDGLDLLKFISSVDPDLSTYLITAQSDSPGFKAKIEEVGYSMSRVFNKQDIPLTEDDEAASAGAPRPWHRVRSDILVNRSGDGLSSQDLDQLRTLAGR